MRETIDKMLASVDWQEFEIGEVFDIFTGALISRTDYVDGEIPLISATRGQNGVFMFTDKVESRNFRTNTNFISVSFLGDVFYHPYKVSLGMKIHGIKPKAIELNKYSALFLIPVIRNFTVKYSYGNQLSSKLLKRQKLLLPTTTKGEPDWQFMEEYMKLVETHIKPELDLSGHLVTDNRELNEVDWQEFEIVELFEEIRIAQATDMNKLNEGTVPFIGRSSSQNGYQGNVDVDVSRINHKGTITVGMVGESRAFYQPFKFTCSQNILILGSEHLNEYKSMFINTILNKHLQVKGYGYGYPVSLYRIRKDKLYLPTTTEGEPDWHFMEQYMKRLENEITTQVS